MPDYTTPWGDNMPMLAEGSPMTSAPTSGAPMTSSSGGGSNPMDWASAAGGIGGGEAQLLQYLFGKDPSKGASDIYSQIGPMLEKYMSPYAEMGTRAMGQLEPQYASLLSDPGAVMSKIGGGFQKSPGYDFAKEQALSAGGRAAAAGGMAGSPMQQEEAQKTATGLANQDYYNYLDRAMNMYKTGLSGEQGMLGIGADVSKGLGEDMASSMMSQANLKYARDQQRQNQLWGSIGSMLGGGGSLAAMLAMM